MGRTTMGSAVSAHAYGADAAIVLALLATITAIRKLRARLDIVIGSIVFTLLLAF